MENIDMNPGVERNVLVKASDSQLLQYFMENSFPVSADSKKDIALRRGAFVALLSAEGYVSAIIAISDDYLAEQVEVLNASNKLKTSTEISKQ
jgi:hypothetical protein